MALKRLTLQAKKSFPGLCSSDNPESQQVQSAMALKRFTLHAKKSIPGLYSSNNPEDTQPSTCVASDMLPMVHY
jgi:hypothetical protein